MNVSFSNTVFLREVSQAFPILFPNFSIFLFFFSKTGKKNLNITMYSNDVFTLSSGHNRKGICSRLQRSINNVVGRLHILGLALSSEKCSAMTFSRRQFSRYPVKIYNLVIPFST